MHFLLVAKPTDHKHLFEEVKQAQQEGLMTTMQWQEKDSAVTCEIQFSFAMLLMITFLIDQTQERCCPVFQAVRKKFSSRTSVWDWVRSHFRHFGFTSMQHLYEAIINDSCRNIPYPTLSFYGSRVT